MSRQVITETAPPQASPALLAWAQLLRGHAATTRLLSAELHGLGADHDRHLPDHLAAVSLDQANEIAHRLLDPSRAVIVVAGPWVAPATTEAVVMSAAEASAADLLARSYKLR